MAIGLGAAVLGSAVLGAGASAIGSSKQSKAAKDAANISSADNAANRAFLTGIYDKNVGYLAPWMQSGQQANSAFMELLGFAPAATSAFTPASTPTTSAFAPSTYPATGPFQRENPSWDLDLTRRLSLGYGGDYSPQTMTAPAGAVTTAAPSARSAFDTYRNSTGYDFRFGEGVRALQSAFSRNLDSGAAQKAAMRFGQGIGSDEFGRYMQLLGDQSRLGLSGASALAGVGQNFGNTVTAGNTAAANAQANARLYAGNAAAQNWANLGSSFGSALGWLAK